MYNETTVEKQAKTAVQIYFAGGDWLGFLKATDNKKVRDLFMEELLRND